MKRAITIDGFIEKHKLIWGWRKLTVLRSGWPRDAKHYFVTITSPQGSMNVTYSEGSAHPGNPKLKDVMICLQSDAAVDSYRDIRDWASEFGLEIDAQTKSMYADSKKAVRDLRRILGDEGFNEFMSAEEN